MPKYGVHSEPEYVVGTATSGRPVAADTAFAVSIALPPPTATRPSAFAAASVAAVTTSTGAWRRTSREPFCDGEIHGREAFARDEQWTVDAELAEERAERVEPPADDHEASRSRAKATNASATRVRARPVAEASEISRVASRPSTRASVRRPAARSDSTAVREMNVTP